MSKSFRLTREELYKLVWSEPKIELAKGLGISDVAITKICRKLSVPMPPQGYWLQKHKPKKPALPATKGAPFHVVHLYEPRVSPEVVPLDPQAAILLAYEENPKHHCCPTVIKVAPIAGLAPIEVV